MDLVRLESCEDARLGPAAALRSYAGDTHKLSALTVGHHTLHFTNTLESRTLTERLLMNNINSLYVKSYVL